MKTQRYKCPKCDKKNAVEIIYGFPTDESFKLFKDGKVKLGGCCHEIGAPDRSCPDCKHEWDSEIDMGKAVKN
jgi:hypothetical protein